MKKRILTAAVAAMMALGCIMTAGCKEEEEENHNYTDSSLGLEFSDSIIVKFGDVRWATKEYTSHIEHDDLWDHDWIFVETHKPGSTYPAVQMKFFKGEGAHTAYMVIYNTPLGFSLPSLEMYGDPECGYAHYYELGEVSSPDGTRLSDWQTKEITMEVMKYVDSTKQATAYIHGTMLNYRSWYESRVSGALIDVDSVETRQFSITFADLPVAQ